MGQSVIVDRTLVRFPGDRRFQSGFTLLEVLIAMLILSLGAGSVLSLFAAAASTHRRALDRTQSALVAERLLAELQARYTPEATDEEILESLRGEVPPELNGYAWELYLYRPGGASNDYRGSEGDGAFHPKELIVRVLVRWKQSGQARSQIFHSLLLPRNVGNLEEDRDSGQRRSRRLRRR